MIRYRAPILDELPARGVSELDLVSGGYHLVVARFEPENHVLEIVEGYRRSAATLPLVVVGSAPYSADYTRAIDRAAEGDARIRLVGGVYDQELLDALYANAATYLHGHSVGGTNPSLLRAMGAGTAVIAYDVAFNREVLHEQGWFFRDAADVAAHLVDAEADAVATAELGAALRERARDAFRWDEVADAYEELAHRLADGSTIHGSARRARRRAAEWEFEQSRQVRTP
jgi:glycosyltransferase involved in cell wall biosynthesis